jgi:hypothetical protein
MRGGSQAHLMPASDNADWIGKHQNNQSRQEFSPTKMFATKLGLCLGLPMPGVAVIEVSDWLATLKEERRVEIGGVAVPCGSGLQFASRYPCDPALDPWGPC